MDKNINLETIDEVRAEALRELQDISSLSKLDEWRVSYLGRNGSLTNILRKLGSVPLENRRQIGATANQAKLLLEEKLDHHRNLLANAKTSSESEDDVLDVTLPGWPLSNGNLHPSTKMLREITKAFSSMGFQVQEGPEIEWDRYNFDLLNIPSDHPARDMWDTLWLDYTDKHGNTPMLLRTHTSPMQARIMENAKPPIRVLVPGKCYRYEATDSTHEWQFFQVEGLAIGEGITFAELKGTLYEFVRCIFGDERKIRFRCDFFPFVEPGVDMSISNFVDPETGKRPIDYNQDWIEILGAGMVHPNVLKNIGYDPDVYSGFAFGMGVERIAMLKYGIDDIRLFYSNDLRFLEQF